jgi:hypothetical protein
MDPSPSGATGSDGPVNDAEPIPLGQRLFDNMYLLLALGVFVMLTVFTAWGLWEILRMPKGTLP